MATPLNIAPGAQTLPADHASSPPSEGERCHFIGYKNRSSIDGPLTAHAEADRDDGPIAQCALLRGHRGDHFEVVAATLRAPSGPPFPESPVDPAREAWHDYCNTFERPPVYKHRPSFLAGWHSRDTEVEQVIASFTKLCEKYAGQRDKARDERDSALAQVLAGSRRVRLAKDDRRRLLAAIEGTNLNIILSRKLADRLAAALSASLASHRRPYPDKEKPE